MDLNTIYGFKGQVIQNLKLIASYQYPIEVVAEAARKVATLIDSFK